MPNAMSQWASEEPKDQVQGDNLTKQNRASNTTGLAPLNGTSGNTDISEEDADAWYRNHNVPPNSFASASSRSSSSSTSSVATTPGFTDSSSISNNSAETRETSPPSLATTGDGSPVINHHHQQPQHHPQQQNHHPHPNPFLTPDLDDNLNHPQNHQRPPPAQDPLFRHLCTIWVRHLHHILQAHALLNERRRLREAEWRLWVLMNEETPRLARVVRDTCAHEDMHFKQENSGSFQTHYVLFTQSKPNLLSLIPFTITIANKITTMNQHNMHFVMAQLQPSTTTPIPPALPSMDQSDNECFSHHAYPTEPPPKPSEADRNVTIASKDETRHTAVSPTIHPDASEDISRPAFSSTSTPASYDTYSVLLTVVWLGYLPDYLPPRRRRQRCRVHCRRHQHARHCFGGVDHTAQEEMDLDDFTDKDGGDIRWRRYYPYADETAHSHG
ncbi:hypothetical protein QR685DRAFT_597841 [Neurospora intermedia]|uniref:Nitrogen regulatory protein areA GATA-like domain-containing protein n=1 Tax=Neurospora intermedia TaxID=5142 RepID=A0ABR3DC64_NEUIN